MPVIREGGNPSFGCRWEYRGVPCRVVGVILHDVEGREGKSEVVGLIVNTGVGPDIEVLFEQGDLRYEVLSV
jgi:hypothetical protein